MISPTVLRALLACVLLVAPGITAAEPVVLTNDPDLDLARQHFERGRASYAEGRFEEAVRAFERARALKAYPALDYDIARCYDRMERWAEAAAAYRRFASAGMSASAAQEAASRALVLERRAESERTTGAIQGRGDRDPATPPRGRPRHWRLGVGLGVGLGVAAVGAVAATLAVLYAGPRDPDPTLGSVAW